MAEIALSLVVGGDPERSYELSQELAIDIGQLRGIVVAEVPPPDNDPDKRGDPSVASIIIAAVSSGGALSALASTIGFYLKRDRRTELKIESADGSKLSITSQLVTSTEIKDILRKQLAKTGDGHAKGRNPSRK